MGKIRLFGVANDSIVDGPGLRYSVYTQGCSHACPGCHNKDSWDFEGGYVVDTDELIEDIESNKLINDVTLSGGDPFQQPEAVAELAKKLADKHYNMWAYSGYTLEELIEMSKTNKNISDILEVIDVLVDGPFIESKKSLELHWKGSSNQRVIDMKAYRQTGEIKIWEDKSVDYEIPENW